MADQYGNPVSDGTVINFVTEGGAVGSSAAGRLHHRRRRLLGHAAQPGLPSGQRPRHRARLCAGHPGLHRPERRWPVQLHQFQGAGWLGAGSLPSAGRYLRVRRRTVRADGRRLPRRRQPGVGEDHAHWRSSSLDGIYEPANGDKPFPYNHTGYSAAPQASFGVTYIRRSIEIIFSGSAPTLVRQVCSGGTCRDWTAADGDAGVIAGLAGTGCSTQTLRFRIADTNDNPMPAGTIVDRRRCRQSVAADVLAGQSSID